MNSIEISNLQIGDLFIINNIADIVCRIVDTTYYDNSLIKLSNSLFIFLGYENLNFDYTFVKRDNAVYRVSYYDVCKQQVCRLNFKLGDLNSNIAIISRI